MSFASDTCLDMTVQTSSMTSIRTPRQKIRCEGQKYTFITPPYYNKVHGGFVTHGHCSQRVHVHKQNSREIGGGCVKVNGLVKLKCTFIHIHIWYF